MSEIYFQNPKSELPFLRKTYFIFRNSKLYFCDPGGSKLGGGVNNPPPPGYATVTSSHILRLKRQNQMRVYSLIIDCPNLRCDTRMEVTLVARPLLTPVA